MKLGKTEQRILADIVSRGSRLNHWWHSASYSRGSTGRREVNACMRLHDRGLVDIQDRHHYNVYMGSKEGMVSVFEITIVLKPEYRAWATLGGKV